MATIKKTNIYNYLKTKFSNTASHIKMNGSQSAGSSDLMARADHVHPSDTSRAPTSHASSDTTYGVSSASNYGHAKASGTTPKSPAASASVGSETGSFARGDHVHPLPATASTSAKGIVQMDSAPTASSNNAVTSGGLKTVLDTKQNEVETQSKIVGFTNKDRINIERLLNYMNHASPYQYANYYTLDIECAGIYNLMETPGTDNANIRQSYSGHQPIPMPVVFSEKDKLATVTKTNMQNYEYSQKLLFCAMISKDTAEQTSNKTAITFKLIDGTVLGTSTVKLSSDIDANGPLRYYTYLCLDNTWEAGIYYVYAEATLGCSVVRSPILSVFVKDNNNLYDHALWSCGEYDNINIIANYGKAKITEQFSTIGEKSIAYQQSNPANYGYFYVDSTNTLNSGENYTVSLDCYCPDANFTFIVRQDGELSRVIIPRNPSMQHISLSFTSNRSASFRIQFFNDVSDSRVFIDNLSCIKL